MVGARFRNSCMAVRSGLLHCACWPARAVGAIVPQGRSLAPRSRAFNGGNRLKLQSTVVNVLLTAALLLPFSCVALSTHDRSQTSALSALVTTSALAWVVVSPALGVSAAADSIRSDGDVDEAGDGAVDRTKAGPRPPLKVTGVDPQANGDIHVAVEVVGQPGQHGVLNWPAREDNPAEALRAGDVLAFTPSDEGAGWFVGGEDGQSLTFLPAERARQGATSARW